MIVQCTIWTLILSVISMCNGYRILAIFPFHGRSHFHVLEPIAKALAQKGHQVDVMSNFKLKEPFPNYTELEFPTAESHASIEFSITTSEDLEREWVNEQETRMCNLLANPKIAEFIKNPPKNPAYDAILVHMLTGYQCFTGIGYIWDVPVIGIVTTTPYVQFQQIVGNPLSLAIAPGMKSHHKENFTFWERVCNVVNTHRFLWAYHDIARKQDFFLKKYLGPDVPSYRELQKNLALLFTNSHYSFYGIKPKTPAIIEIGGINIKNDTSKLDLSLKQLLDESDNGFIYFSFGTLTVLESLPCDLLESLYSAFRKISPVRVIMRVPNPDIMPKNVSDNVYMFDWLPQQKILGHPNIKGFVTHGGGLSSQEAIHYAVPVICIPLFAEQKLNCDIFAFKNMGVQIFSSSAKQQDYDIAFRKILSKSVYKESMKTFSLLYWDRPQSPQEAVNYWVEYVIRHGKNVLKSPAVNLEWWQFELIDVYCFLVLCCLFATVFTVVTLGYTLKLLVRLSNSVSIMNSSKKYE